MEEQEQINPEVIEWTKELILQDPRIRLPRLNRKLDAVFGVTLDTKTKARIKKEVIKSERGQAVVKAINVIKKRPDITIESLARSVKFIDLQEVHDLKVKFSKPNPYSTVGSTLGRRRVSPLIDREYHAWDRPELIPNILDKNFMLNYPTRWLPVLSAYSFIYERGWLKKYSKYYGFALFTPPGLRGVIRSMYRFINKFTEPWYLVSASIAFLPAATEFDRDLEARIRAIRLYKKDTGFASGVNTDVPYEREALEFVGRDLRQRMSPHFSQGYPIWLISATITVYRGI